MEDNKKKIIIICGGIVLAISIILIVLLLNKETEKNIEPKYFDDNTQNEVNNYSDKKIYCEDDINEYYNFTFFIDSDAKKFTRVIKNETSPLGIYTKIAANDLLDETEKSSIRREVLYQMNVSDNNNGIKISINYPLNLQQTIVITTDVDYITADENVLLKLQLNFNNSKGISDKIMNKMTEAGLICKYL